MLINTKNQLHAVCSYPDELWDFLVESTCEVRPPTYWPADATLFINQHRQLIKAQGDQLC